MRDAIKIAESCVVRCGRTAGQQNSVYQLVSVCGTSSLSIALAHLTWRCVPGWQRWAGLSNRSSVAACVGATRTVLRVEPAVVDAIGHAPSHTHDAAVVDRDVEPVAVGGSQAPSPTVRSGPRNPAPGRRPDSRRCSGQRSPRPYSAQGLGDPVPHHVSRLPSRSRSKRQSRHFPAGMISACMFLCIIVSAASPSSGSMCATASGATTTEKCRT